jgi:hypothetical protein
LLVCSFPRGARERENLAAIFTALRDRLKVDIEAVMAEC